MPHALAARTAIRRGEWTTAVTAAERARAAGPEDPRAVDALHAQIDALLQLGRRAEAYALAHRALSANGASGATGGAPAETAARLYARVVLGDRRLDGRGLGDRAALPLDERTAALWPVVFVAGLDAALRAWPGPDAALVARARAASTQLDALAPEGRPSEIAWARTLIDAAIAASQDEHPELALRLVHAIDMERALAAADPAALPLLPARELGAELWLRTYRYDDARRDARALARRAAAADQPVRGAGPRQRPRQGHEPPPPRRGGASSSSAPPPTPTTRSASRRSGRWNRRGDRRRDPPRSAPRG